LSRLPSCFFFCTSANPNPFFFFICGFSLGLTTPFGLDVTSCVNRGLSHSLGFTRPLNLFFFDSFKSLGFAFVTPGNPSPPLFISLSWLPFLIFFFFFPCFHPPNRYPHQPQALPVAPISVEATALLPSSLPPVALFVTTFFCS